MPSWPRSPTGRAELVKKTLLTLVSWLAGIAAMVGLFLYYRPQGFWNAFDTIGVIGIAGWTLLTLGGRVTANEATVIPLAALGFRLTRADAFWISWIRTFVNQITPLAGAAAYVHMIRRHTGIAWSQVAALGQPQIILVATAIGIVGLAAVALNLPRLGASALGLAGIYGVLVVVTLAIASGTHWLLEALPERAAERVLGTSNAMRTMAKSPKLMLTLLAYHTLSTILRGARVWFLFDATGVSLGWGELLLVLAVTESSLLLNITPGALGVREGAILAGAGLIGIPAATASAVALIDRIFMVALTSLLAVPSVLILRKPKVA